MAEIEGPYINCDGLVKIYQMAGLEIVALQGLNLTVDEGELMGIVGVSGSGKSTLMSILGGLDRPTAGKVSVGRFDLLKMTDRNLNRYRREQVGFVWQQSARNLVPYLSARANVILPMTLAGASGRVKRERAKYLLEMVGLGDRMKHHLRELSGGEQQRVAIAVALANNPLLLLADEPTGEVDTATAGRIYDTIAYLNQEFNLTTMIVSHDPGIAHHVTRVVSIRDGMLASETRRRTTATNEVTYSEITEERETHFDELVILDTAGRLQLPQELLDRFDIKGRATIDFTEDGIIIKPVDRERIDAPELEAHERQEAQILQDALQGNKRRFGLFRRRRRRKQLEAEQQATKQAGD